jgi:hypothetical protein
MDPPAGSSEIRRGYACAVRLAVSFDWPQAGIAVIPKKPPMSSVRRRERTGGLRIRPESEGKWPPRRSAGRKGPTCPGPADGAHAVDTPLPRRRPGRGPEIAMRSSSCRFFGGAGLKGRQVPDC